MMSESEGEIRSGRTILVAGVLKDYEDVLEALVSNKRKGGGAIQSFQYDDVHEVAWITFEDAAVAEFFLKTGAIKIQGLTMKVLLPPSPRTLFVRSVSSEANEVLELFIESPSKGGGPISDYSFDVHSETVTVSFEQQEVADRLLNQKFIDVKGKKFLISNVPPEALLSPPPLADGNSVSVEEKSEQDDADAENADDVGGDNTEALSRTVCIQNVPSQMVEFLEIVLTQEKSGGGNIEQLIEDGDNVMVTFEDSDVASRFLEAGVLKFGSSEFAIVPPPSSFDRTDSQVFDEHRDNEEDNLPPATVLVRGIPKLWTEDVLLAVLGRDQDGGGRVVSLQFQTGDEQTIVQFEDYHVAQNLLHVGHIRFKQTTLEIVPVPEEKLEVVEDEDTIEIQGIPKGMDKHILQLFLENKKRSGGGEVVELNLNEATERAIVKFKDIAVAKSLLESGKIKYVDGSILEVRRPSSSPDGLDDASEKAAEIPGQVEISEIPVGTKKDTLVMFLENKKRSGGGEIAEDGFSYDDNSRTAMVTFKDPAIAEQMLQKGQITFGKSVIQVQKPTSAFCASVHHSVDRNVETDQVKSRTIEIRGSLKDLSKDNLSLYFENKRSGGGPVHSVQILSKNSAVIVFKQAADAARVAEKHEHQLSKVMLRATLLDSWPDVGGPCAIRVQGFKTGTSRDVIEMYFENSKRSGGDGIDELLYEEGDQTAVITFRNPQVVQRVTGKDHVLEGSKLTVEALMPCRPPVLLKFEEIDPDKLLFTKLNSLKLDSSKLQEFAGKAAKAPVTKIIYSSNPGRALVQYARQPDYESVKTIVCSRPFQGKMISVERVQIAKCIQVHSIGTLSQDTLELYFESAKAGGGNLNIQTFNEGSHAIIEFTERDVVQKVLSKKHTFNGQGLDVQLYCPSLGIFPPGFDGSSPGLPIPPDFVLECDNEIVRFLLTAHQKKHIEHHLKKRRCFLIWPRHSGNKITLRCTIESKDHSAAQMIPTWKGDCESFLKKEINNVRYGEMNVLGEIWNSFKDKVSANRNQQESQLLLTEFDDQRHVLFFSGYAREAENFEKLALDVKGTLEEALDRSKREIKESAGLKPHQAYLVKATNFLHSQSDVRFEDSAKGFTIIGQPTAVRQAKLKMFEIAQNMSERLVDFKAVSGALEKALNKPAMHNHVHECFAKSNVMATYEVRKKDVMLYTIDAKQLDHAHTILVTEVVENSVQLDEPMREVLRRKDWTTYRAGLVKDFPLLELSESNASVAFVSKKSDIAAISQRIKDFLSGNAHYERFVSVLKGEMEVLKLYGNADLEQLKEGIKPAEMKESLSSSGECGFSIRGKKLDMERGVTNVKKFLTSVCSSEHAIHKKQEVKLFASETGQLLLHGIGSKRNVVIKFADDEKVDSKNKVYSDPVIFATAKLHTSGKFLKLVLGDITKDKTDTIVNAANSRLEHGSGVARAIAKAGHQQLSEECRQHVQKVGDIRPGTVFVSSAGGSLPHKSVIHTVGPVWKEGKSGEDRDLEAAISAALREAEFRQYQSISMPFLSCGLFGFPKKRAAAIIVRTIKDFLRNSKFVYDVHIVNGLQDCLDALQSALNDFSSDFALTPSAVNGPSSGTRRSTAVKRPHGKYKTGSHSQSPRSGTDSLKTREGITLRLIRGSIASSKVDAIFNSAEKDLNLTHTAISKSLLMSAGSGLQAECQASYPQGIGYGNVVKTGAHKLPCKAVYHGACARWDNDAGNSEQVIRKLVSSALQMATDDGMTSLAFPAIGTGIKLRTPSNVVARLTIEETIKFSAKVPNTSLTEIQFVIYEKDQDTLDAFEKGLQSSDGDGKNASIKGDSDEENDIKDETDDDDDDDEEEEEEERAEEHDSEAEEDEDGKQEDARGGDSGDSDSSENGHDIANQSGRIHEHRRGGRGGRRPRGRYHPSGHEHSRRRTNYSPATAAPGVTCFDCQIGDIRFLVKREDIIRSSANAIVNGTNDKLNLKMGKLSRAIFTAAGSQIQTECMQYGGIQNGMALSSGGQLPFTCIYHITANDTKGWKAVIGNVLQEADGRQLKSIAIPPVGVGRGSVSTEDLADAIFDEVDKFSQKRPQFLQTITVSILDEGILHDFVAATEKAMKLMGKPFKKLLSKASDMAKGVLNDIKDSLAGVDDSKEDYGRKKSYKGRKAKPKPHLQPSKCVLRIYGLNESNVSSAISDIQQRCKETKSEQILDFPAVVEAISKLTADQERKLKSLEKKCKVEIHIDKTPGRQKIRLVNDDGDVNAATAEIYEILLGMVMKERNSRELELYAKQAIWQFNEGGTFKLYGRYAIGTIEKAYHHRKPTLEYTDSKNVKHSIDFKAMTDDRSSGGKVPIKRTIPGSIPLPTRWKPMTADENSVAVTLNPNDEEYKKVATSLKATASSTVQTIVKIERIQNPTLYRQFMNRKLDMDRMNAGQENEKRLWHGTNGTNVININNRNFNRSYCGQHGTAIGNGVYFASSASYSVSGYCPVDGAGQKHIYQARVLTGKYCQGQSGLKEAPALPNRADVTYDSVVNSTSSPSMFVVFLDYQTYPEYHITFT